MVVFEENHDENLQKKKKVLEIFSKKKKHVKKIHTQLQKNK